MSEDLHLHIYHSLVLRLLSTPTKGNPQGPLQLVLKLLHQILLPGGCLLGWWDHRWIELREAVEKEQSPPLAHHACLHSLAGLSLAGNLEQLRELVVGEIDATLDSVSRFGLFLLFLLSLSFFEQFLSLLQLELADSVHLGLVDVVLEVISLLYFLLDYQLLS